MKRLQALSVILLAVSASSYATQVQFGSMETDSSGNVLTIDSAFTNPVVFAGLPTHREDEPGVVSVKKTALQVELRFAEWPYLDGSHGIENVPYLVLEQGRHLMQDGSIWEVGTFGQGASSHVQYFQKAFAGQPVVILSPQSQNDAKPYTVRASSVSKHGFSSRIYEQEAGGSHAAETIGYLAIYSQQSLGTINETLSYHHDVVLSKSGQHYAPLGKIHLNEEQSKDVETTHIYEESLGILQIKDAIFATDQTQYGSDTISLSYTPFYMYDLTEFSERNNIALIGTNGLTNSNYSASTTYASDLPSSAFDGYGYNSKIINEDASIKEARGTWISYRNAPQWLEVNMANTTLVTGFRVVNLSYLTRSPKDVVFQVSQDGINFTDVGSFSLAIGDDTVTLSKPVIGQYFRIHMTTNHGDGTYYKVDDVELYGQIVSTTGEVDEPDKPTEIPVTISCNTLNELYPQLSSGEYVIDPDGDIGAVSPFSVYCDMETQGGGWTLFANHKDGIENVATLSNVLPNDYGVMEAQKWQALKNTITVGFMFKDEYARVSILQNTTMSGDQCRKPGSVSDLANIAVISDYGTLWHYESTGCEITGLDYSLVLLADADSSRNGSYTYQGASLKHYSDKKFYIWPYSSMVSRDEQNELLYFVK